MHWLLPRKGLRTSPHAVSRMYDCGNVELESLMTLAIVAISRIRSHWHVVLRSALIFRDGKEEYRPKLESVCEARDYTLMVD